MQRRWLILFLGLGVGIVARGQGNPPDPARIKAAAEAGDAKAQYEYGKVVPASRMAERLDWFYRSARAGYAPAQEALGSYFAMEPTADQQKRAANLYESVRWSSRAAYQGVYTAQLRIAQFYRKGEVLPKDRVAAYLWMRMGINNSPLAIIYKSNLDQLLAEMSPAEITEAENRLKAFELKTASKLNPIEAELLFAQLQLGAPSVVNGVRQAVVNNVSFAQGETKELKLGGESVRVVCFSIDEKSVLVGIAGTPYIHWLKR
jgi:hypothetical protein